MKKAYTYSLDNTPTNFSENYIRDLNSSPAIIWITNEQGLCIYVSQEWHEYSGQTTEAALGYGWLEVIHPDDKDRTDKIFTEASANKISFHLEYRLKDKNGDYRWAIGKANPRYDLSGKFLGYSGTVFDIHDQKIAQQQIHDTASQFKTLIDSIPQLAWVGHADGRVFWYNQRWYDFTGTTPEQMEGDGWKDVHDPQTLPYILEKWDQSIVTGDPFELMYPLKNASGKFRWFLTRVVPIKDNSGKVVRWFGTNTDIQEQREVAMDLKLKGVAIENSLNGFDIVDEKGNFIYVNRAYLKMWGYDSADEVMATQPQDHCADSNIPSKIIKSLKEKGQCDIEFVAKRKDGSTFDVRMLALLARDAEGREIYPTTSIDITEQKKFEEHLKQSEERFRTYAEAMPHMAFVSDARGSILYYNGRHCDYFGHKMDEKEGWKWKTRKWIHPDDISKTIKTWTESLKTGKHYNVEYRLRRHTGEYRWHVGRAVPYMDSSGKILQWFGTNTDIHEQKLAADELKKSKMMAEEANLAKGRFLANMSHEIRTPLGVITGFAELALDHPDLPQDVQKSLEAIKRNGTLLTQIIGEILDLAKVESKQIQIEKINFNFKQLIKEVVSSIQLQANVKGVQIQTEFLSNAPDLICSDPTRIKQILMNILGNAVKFTEKGLVTVKIQSIKENSKKLRLKITIEDTGIGITPKQQKNLFKHFSQADSSMTRRYGGTGLGLVLARQLAAALGGDVKLVKSKANEGSTFLCEIQAESVAEEFSKIPTITSVPPSYDRDRLKGMDVLLVEDSLDNQMLFTRYLKSMGANIEIADNGAEGVKKALNQKYSLVLMDIQMPVMNGHEATAELRKKGFEKPIIALTAHALSEERDRALEGGFSEYLTKPLNKQVLIDTIVRLTRNELSSLQ